MENELLERERNNTMPKLKKPPLDDKINIDQIQKNIRATQILYKPLDTFNEDLNVEKLPEDTKNYDKSIKIILLGDSSVGKSSIVHFLSNSQYNNYQRKSLGLEHYNYVIKINNIIIRMQLWDTVGEEKFESLTSNYYKNTDVAIFIYAINNLNSFNKIEQMDSQLNEKEIQNDEFINNEIQKKENNKGLIKVLLGNKKDLENERKVSYEQGKKLSEEKKFSFFQEICCNSEIDENGENKNFDEIIDLLDNIGKMVYKEIKNDRDRLNSASYCYQASASMIYSDDSSRKKGKNGFCCLCSIV